jgi:CHAD domain-containing protein
MTSSISSTGQDKAHDGREVEWQLASDDLGSVRRWLADHGKIDGLIVEPRSTLQIHDTYLDTEDWRIHRAGFALRIRSESGKSHATLKSLHSASATVADRRELSQALGNPHSDSIRKSPGPVGTRVLAVSGTHALVPLFEVRTSRQRFSIHREDEQQPLGEIDLDETVISRPHGEPRTSMQRVEVEALTAAHEPLQLLVDTLRSNCALEAAPDSKFSRGLESVGLAPAPAPEFAPTVVDASMPMVEVALANLRRYWSGWHFHEPGARLGDDPEALHELRVTGRRLEAILRQFRSSLPVPLLRIRPVLKKVLRALGAVRDLDVALSELAKFRRKLPDADHAGIEPFGQYLIAERTRARTRMFAVLDSASVRKAFQKLTLLLTTPSTRAAGSPAELALNAAPESIRRRYRKVRKSAARLTPDSPLEAYHAVRSHVKKLRYILEAVAVIYGKPADDMLRALHRWQEKLGVQQDAAVGSRRLTVLASAPPKGIPPETLFMMGRLAEHYAADAARARKVYPRAFRKVRGRWKKLRTNFSEPALPDAPPLADAAP